MRSRYYVGDKRHVEGLYYPVYTLPARGAGRMRQATPSTRQFIGLTPLAGLGNNAGSRVLLTAVALMALGGIAILALTSKEESPFGF